MILLSLVGIGVSIYLTYIHYMVTGGDGSFSSFCNVNASVNCDAVAASEWSILFGIPVALWGMLFYIVFAELSFLKIIARNFLNITIYLFWMSVLSLLYSIFLFYISKFVLETWCILCAVLWITNLLFFILTLKTNKPPLSKHFSIIWQDFKWLFSKPLRGTAIFVLIVILGLGLTYTTHLEAKKQELQRKLAPKFISLKHKVSTQGFSFGSDSPKVTIVEFSDFECPHCSTVHKLLKSMAEKYPSLKVVHKDYPLDHACNPIITKPFHTTACDAALFLRCAGEQGKYWDAFSLLFDQQSILKFKNYDVLAGRLKIDENKITTCMANPKTMQALKKDIEEGVANGFQGTPVIIFDGTERLMGWGKGKLEKAIKIWRKK